jgi:hypothetical protein
MRRIAVCLILLALCSLPARAAVSTNVPLGDWSYDAVEKLANYGLIDSAMLTTKPLSRLEMARHVGEAQNALEGMEDPPQVLLAIVERLVEEYRGEIIQLGLLEGSFDGRNALKPIEDPYVRYLYARQRPDLENRRGDLFQRGSNYRAGFASRATLFNWFAFYLHPEYAGSSEAGHDVDLIEGYGKVMIGPIELEGGKDSLWWGPARRGSILMSNNAEPLPMLKLTNPQPILLPWIFRALGPIRAEWFLAQLERDRDYPHAKLSGIRVNFKPHPLVELGASRVVMFGGDGLPDVGLVEYAKAFLALSEEAQNNQLAGVDASVLIPLPENRLLRSARFYVDAAGEDEAGFIPSKWAYLFGLQFNDIFKTGRTDLRVEYANTYVPGWPGVFYSHSLYTSGYTYRGRVIGHPIGTDARSLSLQVSHYVTDDLVVDVAYDRRTQTVAQGRRTNANIVEVGVTWFPDKDWQVAGGYRFEQNDNGAGDDNHIVEVGLIRRF